MRTATAVQAAEHPPLTPLKPLGHRILVKPDAQPKQTESGFYIPDGVDIPPMSGTVIALGNGPYRDRQLRRATIARCLAILDGINNSTDSPELVIRWARDEMQRYMASIDGLDHLCDVGQRVIFPMEAGHEIVFGEAADEALVLLNEDSVIAVYEKESPTV